MIRSKLTRKGREVKFLVTSKELIGEKEIDESTTERCRIGFGCIYVFFGIDWFPFFSML